LPPLRHQDRAEEHTASVVPLVVPGVPEAFDTQLSSNVLAGASFQMVALLRHPDGVDQPARGDVEQISIGAVAECGVGRPVRV
jgi:hypothetical protein